MPLSAPGWNKEKTKRKNFHAASGAAQIKKVRVQVLGRGLKNIFLNGPASSRLGHRWLIFNHCKLPHFCFLSNLYWVKLLLYPVRKDSSLASRDSQFFSLLTNWMIRLLLLGGDIHPNPGPQTHKWVCDICLKPITKHQTSISCNYTKYWVHLKCFQITTKDYNNSWYCTLHRTFNHRTQTNTTSPKNFLKVLQLNGNATRNKTNKIQLLIKNTQAGVITMQETKLNQSHKTPNISHFTPIRTNRTHKQGGGLLTYIKNNISFSQLNISNTFPIKLQILKINLSTTKQLHIANMYMYFPPSYHKQKTQLYRACLQP